MAIVLIHPPVSRPCEPPPGLAYLSGALKAHDKESLVIDANMEGLTSLLDKDVNAGDTFTRRAAIHLDSNITSIRNRKAFKDMGHYTRAVTEISHILEVAARRFDTHVSLNNLEHNTLSPLRSADLILCALHPEANVFHSYFEMRLSALLDEHAPGIVGFSLNFLSQALTTFAMIGFLKKMDPCIHIVLGGSLVTSWMRRPDWINPFEGLVDELVQGPGEERILALAGVETHQATVLPDYNPFWHYGYLSPLRVVPFRASCGCYWARCSFCPERIEKNKYSSIPARNVPNEINTLTSTASAGLVHITDNAMSPALLMTIADQKIDAPWYGFARITHHLTDREFCSGLKRSGCVMLKLGLESGDQGVLDELCKGIRLDEAAKALRSLHDSGIATYVYLLFGTPPEDEASAQATLDFVSAHAGTIDFLNTSIFNLPRGSEEAGNLKTYDFFDGDLSLYQGFSHPKGWDRNLIRQFLDKRFKRHPAVSRIVRHHPPFFTSNHAPFFAMDR